jgi:hypothetical protein
MRDPGRTVIRPLRQHTRWVVVVAFAIGMAWVEAATVYYLRVMVDRVQPYQENPLPMHGVLGQVELVREAATLVMLVTVGMLAGRTRRAQAGYAAIAFGVWDIFYYLFLRIIGGWPRSLFDWDVLFLLPLPWWGPVLAPVSIALLMIVEGTLESRREVSGGSPAAGRRLGRLQALGILLALYVFMADALSAVRYGLDAASTVLPETFNWLLFWVAFLLMAAPLMQSAWRQRPRRRWSPHCTPGTAAQRKERSA